MGAGGEGAEARGDREGAEGKAGLLIRKHDHYTPARKTRRDVRVNSPYNCSHPEGRFYPMGRRARSALLLLQLLGPLLGAACVPALVYTEKTFPTEQIYDMRFKTCTALHEHACCVPPNEMDLVSFTRLISFATASLAVYLRFAASLF